MEGLEGCTDNATQLAELLMRASAVIKEERLRSAALAAQNDQLSVALKDLIQEGLKSQNPPAAICKYLRDNAVQLEKLLGSPASISNPIDSQQMLETSAKPSTKNTATSHSSIMKYNLHKDTHAIITSDVAATTATRLRRAFAPTPNKQQLAEVVDVMVKALYTDLKKQVSRREWPLPQEENKTTSDFHFYRLKACTYLFEWGCSDNANKLLPGSGNTCERTIKGSRNSEHLYHSNNYTINLQRHEKRKRQKILNFTIDSGQLCILSGGGHINALEFFERKLHIRC